MTLYRHFKEKDEILKYLIMSLVESIKESYSKAEEKSIGSLIEIRNLEISRNEYLKIALSNKEVEHIVREFIAPSRAMFYEYLELSPKVSQYRINFVIGGIENITTKWILGGMKESYKVITNETMKILSLINKGVEGSL